jgi:hypothetical protein
VSREPYDPQQDQIDTLKRIAEATERIASVLDYKRAQYLEATKFKKCVKCGQPVRVISGAKLVYENGTEQHVVCPAPR